MCVFDKCYEFVTITNIMLSVLSRHYRSHKLVLNRVVYAMTGPKQQGLFLGIVPANSGYIVCNLLATFMNV